MSVPKQPFTKLCQRVALFGYLGLFILMPVWLFIVFPNEAYSPLFVITIYIFPLLLPLKGFIKDDTYTYAWSNFIVLIYFLHGFTSLWISEQEFIFATLEVMFASFMFLGSTFYSKYRGKELGLGIHRLKQDLAKEKALYESQKRNNL